MKKLALLLLLGLAVAACGGAADDAVASLDETTATTTPSGNTEIDSEQALLDFAQCMRDNGIADFPDPSTDADGNVRPFGSGGPGTLDVDPSTLEAARDECTPLIEDLALNFLRTNRADIEDQLVEFASCMRDEGVDMPDPDFSNLLGGGRGDGNGGPFGDIDFSHPDVQDAAETCSAIFGEGLRFPGRGPRGGDNG